MKRQEYLTWDEYFMGIAEMSAQRSKDPSTQVGACIVSRDNKILSVGDNGMPRACSDDIFPWDRDQTIPHSHQLRLLSLLSSNSCQALSHLHLQKVNSIRTYLTIPATSYYQHVQDKMKIVTHFLFQTI